MPLADTLPPPVSADRAMALVGFHIGSLPGSNPSTDRVLVNAPIGGASHDDPFPSDHEEEPPTELVTKERHSASKWRLA